jgi:DNA topoisomerase I
MRTALPGTRKAGKAGSGAPQLTTLHPEGRETARTAGLRYVSDARPGIRRRRCGRSFRYVAPDGAAVRDAETLRRVRSLAIPPAWTGVWICPHPGGHIQATGRDQKGRKQYRYHPRWREVRDETKYDRIIVFAETLPRIRERVQQDLALPGLRKERVLATAVRLLETTFIRVGNEEYAKQNDSFGLTTLRDEHVEVNGSSLHFQFRGKSGKEHEVTVRDPRLARIVKRCQELPGQELFQYVGEDGERHSITSADVNEYLREISGQDFTAKDFRTWAGTLLAFVALRECLECETETEARKNIVYVVRCVADRLGNTPAVCRKCYIHPSILEAYLDRDMRAALRALVLDVPAGGPAGLNPVEAVVLRFLREHVAPAEGRIAG